MNQLIDNIEAEQLKTDIPDFKVGDTVSVHYRIIEGEKERIQVFTGTVIARKGSGISETISIYRVAYGSAMERVLLLHSPRISKIEVVKRGKVRKSKLYYLRGVFGKKAKVKELIIKTAKGAKKKALAAEKVAESKNEKTEAPKEELKPETHVEKPASEEKKED